MAKWIVGRSSIETLNAALYLVYLSNKPYVPLKNR